MTFDACRWEGQDKRTVSWLGWGGAQRPLQPGNSSGAKELQGKWKNAEAPSALHSTPCASTKIISYWAFPILGLQPHVAAQMQVLGDKWKWLCRVTRAGATPDRSVVGNRKPSPLLFSLLHLPTSFCLLVGETPITMTYAESHRPDSRALGEILWGKGRYSTSGNAPSMSEGRSRLTAGDTSSFQWLARCSLPPPETVFSIPPPPSKIRFQTNRGCCTAWAYAAQTQHFCFHSFLPEADRCKETQGNLDILPLPGHRR